MLPFLAAVTGMPTWAWKIVGGAAAIAGLMIAVKIYGDSKIAEGQRKERIHMYGELEVELLANQKLAQRDLTALRADNKKETEASAAAESRILGEIDALERQLIAKLADLARIRTERDEEIDHIPAADLPDEIRQQSRRLSEQAQPPD
jgi:hypothetical protein